MKTKDFSGIINNGPLPNCQGMKIPSDIDDLLDDYIESTNSQLEDIEAAALAYEAGDDLQENAAIARRTLHKIKGESGMMGFEDISEFCHQTEFAFEELAENKRPDMLLRFKDWLSGAIEQLEK